MILTAIGSVASIAGAAFALYQAARARSAAKIASDARDRVIRDQRLINSGTLQHMIDGAITSTGKYVDQRSPEQLAGIDRQDDARLCQRVHGELAQSTIPRFKAGALANDVSIIPALVGDLVGDDLDSSSAAGRKLYTILIACKRVVSAHLEDESGT